MKIVCFSEIQWRYVRTRKQQILSRFPGDWEILFLSSVVLGKRNNFLPERDGRITHVCIPAFKNVPQRPVRVLLSLPPVRFIWNVILYLWVNAVLLLAGFGGSGRVFYVSNIYYAAILPLLPRSSMLYDCNDDPMEFPNTPRWAERYFTRLARSADTVVAVSRGLVERLAGIGVPGAVHVGNGVDYELFAGAAASGVPDEMKECRRPVLGYSGAIAPWFDMELLDLVASSIPEATIVLLGPLFDDTRPLLERLMERRANVRYLGIKPYERLGAYLASLDVCMIPLRRNELMRLADPNKLYEYAAVEKPIVTMKFSDEMEELSDFIHIAVSGEDFVDKIRTALSRGADREKLKEFAAGNSWQARADAMRDIICP